MKELSLQRTNDIISYVGYPCSNPEALMRSLNTFIKQYEQVKNAPQPDKRTKKKQIRQDQESLSEFYKRSEESLLHSYALIGSRKKSLKEKGLSAQQIDNALTALLLTLDINQREKDEMDKLLDKAISDIPETRQPQFKKVFLCGLLPRVYEEHFERKFGVSQSSITNKNSGPGVRFIKAVSELMELDMKEAAIAKAYKDFKE